jgi:hypothetical protein
VWLGGGWRIFALVEAGVGIFVVLAMRDARTAGRARRGAAPRPRLPPAGD